MTARYGKVGLLGLPRTGKSTYLGALWQLVQDPDDPTVVEVDVRGDRAYLQSLGDQVAEANVIRRTDVDSEDGLRLVVGFESLDEIELEVPDLSGETVRLLVEDRVWHPHLRDVVTSADALLLFVHPDRLRQPIRINFTEQILAELMAGTEGSPRAAALATTADAQDGGSESGVQPDQRPRFLPRMACTAAQLTDVVENLLAVNFNRLPLRVGLVISAWDAVDGDPTPDEWLDQNLPALRNFALANSDRLRLEIFGVSAQGGRLPDQRDDLLAKGNVLNRCYARDGVGNPVPLARPLEWALSW